MMGEMRWREFVGHRPPHRLHLVSADYVKTKRNSYLGNTEGSGYAILSVVH
jgi:hypothetical protein